MSDRENSVTAAPFNSNESNTSKEWHREVVGGLWDELGELQFNFLISQGLKPTNYFLDVGCGSLRGGVHFIRYLDPGHYYGIDRDPEILEAARNIELARYNLTDRQPYLAEMDNFKFIQLGAKFHYALAQSVFTHIPLNSIIMCIMNIEKVLLPGGKFFATFFENPDGKFNLEPIYRKVVDGSFYTFFDRDVFHYDFQIFKFICEETSLEVECIGEWSHPRAQQMLVFTKM
jgi:SAM-dependent methyltransferase